VDVAAKATSSQQDEQEHVRRERLALEEIDALLTEIDADTCPHCGKEI
jgi:RNA polymerase-binding transcription factor DksA